MCQNLGVKLHLGLAIFTFAGLLSSPCKACDCAEPEPGPCKLPEGSSVLLGVVTSVKDGVYHFRVEERFTGTEDSEIEVVRFPGCGFPFEASKRYLVEVSLGDDGKFVAGGCSYITRPIERAGALLKQLRALRDHRRPASLFGFLERVQVGEIGGLQPNYDRVLPHIAIRAILRKVQFQTVSDDNGEFRFYNLPRGVYHFEADLPPDLKIGQTILQTPPPPINLGWNQCFESNITALPTGQIEAEVAGPDGRSLDFLHVDLYSASEFDKGERRGRSPDSEPFMFSRLAPGEYVLAIGQWQAYAPAAAYSAPPLRFALHEGEKLPVLHLQVAQSAPVCEIYVRLKAQKGSQYQVKATPDRGEPIYSQWSEPGSLKLRLQKGTQYKVFAIELSAHNCWSEPVLVAPVDVCPAHIDLHVPETCP